MNIGKCKLHKGLESVVVKRVGMIEVESISRVEFSVSSLPFLSFHFNLPHAWPLVL